MRGYGPGGPAAGLSQISGALWTPYQLPSNPTLPFPDHVSGHSTFSAASAEVLKRFTGSDAFKHSVSIAAGSLLLEPAPCDGSGDAALGHLQRRGLRSGRLTRVS
ncbi:hypothetical protein LP419_33975 [Massilia sp. H-1]|nr:hypothetical protein LP419_33975 [Massilia sp. H-1]